MTEGPDPRPETEVLPAPEPKAVPQGSMVRPVLGGVLAAILGFASAQFLPRLWPDPETVALKDQLATQSSDLSALKTQMTELSSTPNPGLDQALADRVTALEALPQPPDLTARLDALDQQISALPVTPQADPVSTATLAQLQTEIDALKSGGVPAAALEQAKTEIEAQLAEAEAKIAAIKTDAEVFAKATTQGAALRQIQSALDSGAPYVSAIADLSGFTLPAVLTDNAAGGLPNVQSLRDSYPIAARAALEAALRANMGQSWTERVATFLRGQTGARSLTPREGDDPDAVLSRAEAAVNAGDLEAALVELGKLAPEGQAAMADWTSRAKMRIDASRAVQDLLAQSDK